MNGRESIRTAADTHVTTVQCLSWERRRLRAEGNKTQIDRKNEGAKVNIQVGLCFDLGRFPSVKR